LPIVIPKVSVVISGKILEDAVASVHERTLQDFDVIVVENGSTEEKSREVENICFM